MTLEFTFEKIGETEVEKKGSEIVVQSDSEDCVATEET